LRALHLKLFTVPAGFRLFTASSSFTAKKGNNLFEKI